MVTYRFARFVVDPIVLTDLVLLFQRCCGITRMSTTSSRRIELLEGMTGSSNSSSNNNNNSSNSNSNSVKLAIWTFEREVSCASIVGKRTRFTDRCGDIENSSASTPSRNSRVTLARIRALTSGAWRIIKRNITATLFTIDSSLVRFFEKKRRKKKRKEKKRKEKWTRIIDGLETIFFKREKYLNI